MLKGQIVSGDFSKIIARVKAGEKLELGELLVIDNGKERFILQVYDLIYGSQISPQNLELVAGMNLEGEEFPLMDGELRNYNLAFLKPLLVVEQGKSRMCKDLPPFFSRLREIKEEDLGFFTRPEKPFYLGKLRSGSKVLGVDIFLPGENVFSEHLGIFSSTGKGKSLDENEPVLLFDDSGSRLAKIGDLVNKELRSEKNEDATVMDNKKSIKVLSLNPITFQSELKKITKFIRHKAPEEMYQLTTSSGRSVVTTGDHNFLIFSGKGLKLTKTKKITTKDYIPQPLLLEDSDNLNEINVLELLKNDKNIFAFFSGWMDNKLKDKKQIQKILSRDNKIRLPFLLELLEKPFSKEELRKIILTNFLGKNQLSAIFPISNELLRFIGYYIAEGYINNKTIRISNSNKLVINDLKNITDKLGLPCFYVKEKEKIKDTIIPSVLFSKLFKALGLGRIAGEKRLPSFAFSLSKQQLSHLLKAYFEGDGTVYEEDKVKKSLKISALTKSEELASDLCYALLKYGILVRKTKKWKKAANTKHLGNWYHQILISGRNSLMKFLKEIGFISKGKKLMSKLDYRANTNVDLIPVIPKQIRRVRESLRFNQGKFSELCDYSQSIISAIELGKRKPSRDLFTKMIKVFENQTKKLDDCLFEDLILFSNTSEKVLLSKLETLRKKLNLNELDLAKKTKLYTNFSEHCIKIDLRRMLITRKVTNSQKVYAIGKVIREEAIRRKMSLDNDLSVFKLDYWGWCRLIGKIADILNFPCPGLAREEQKYRKYARKLKKGSLIKPSSLRKLTKLLIKYYLVAEEAEKELKRVKRLLNLSWDKVKSIKKISYDKKYVYDLSVEDNETFFAGKGGLFVHNSNLMSCIFWDVLDKDFCGMLVLDPHDEYYGRSGLGLKDHPKKEKVVYYSTNPVVGGRSLKINLKDLKPEHFQGALSLSDPQRQLLFLYAKRFGGEWIKAILEEKVIEGAKFFEDTIAVVKRKLIGLLNLELVSGQLYCQGLFDQQAGENTVKDICRELETGKIIILDTSTFSGAIEILIASLIASEIFHKYKFYKTTGELKEKPVISIVLEEAPRVLGKQVLEQGTNIFETLAREGRKFKIGLTAITQLPSEIPKNILANMNTKIILGLEMGAERQAVIESSPQDLSQDSRNIASLDKGEAIVTSIFTKFALPLKIPLFKDLVEESRKKKELGEVELDFSGIEG